MDLPASAYETLFEDAPAPLVLVEPETGEIEECNGQFSELVSSGRDDVVGYELAALASAPEDVGEDIDSALYGDGDAGEDVRWQLRSESGSAIPVEARLSAVQIDGNDRVLARVRETTADRRTLEQRARAIDTAPIGISISDPGREGNPLVYVNDRFEALTGYSSEEAVGRNCRFLQGEDTDPATVAAISDAIDAPEPVTVELRNYRKDGTKFWNRVTIAPVRDEEGDVTNYIGFQEDITERKRDEQELELARDLLETVPIGVLRTDPTPDGDFEYVNPSLVSLLGAESIEQLREYRVTDFYVDPEARQKLVGALRADDDGRARHEVQFETLDGERKDVIVTASLCKDETGTEHVHKIVQEITGRKHRQQRLERYERLVESLPIGFFQNTPGPDGTFTFVNDAMVSMFDADSKAHLREHSVSDLYVRSDERESFSEQLLRDGVVTEREIELSTLDGAELWAAVTAIAREVDGETFFDGVVQDISERKQYEQRLKEQRDNLDVLNQMLRHDIRNDLQLVMAYAGFLEDKVDGEGREYVETIQESVDHAIEITQTARDMADVMLSAEETLQSVSLRNALEGEVEEIRSKYANAVVTVDGRLPETTVVANEMLDSVLRNLLKNAIQHNDSEIPEVQVSATERAGMAVVRIADNGPGVPDSQKDTIFGRGEKGLESEGTGIGLYLVETLLDSYGGDIRIEDNEPSGSVFVVELPTAEQDPRV